MFSLVIRNSLVLSLQAVLFQVVLGLVFINQSSVPLHKDKGLYEPEVVFYLGTKTPYRVIANHNDSVVEYPGCYPAKIFGILRHGTRTPGDKVVNKVLEIISTIKPRNSAQDVTSIFKDLIWKSQTAKQWSSLLDSRPEKILTTEGGNEMFMLGQRFQNRFPTLMPNTFANTSYIFKYTDTQRTKESAKHFTTGLFGEDSSKDVYYQQPLKQDPILRFYKLCKRWRKEVKKNPNSKNELNKYKTSTEVLRMLSRVSNRIGLNYTLTFDTLHLIFTACAFETAWYPGKLSLWCDIFEKEDMEVMEYYEELKYFWRDGYGYDINHNQACPLLRKAMDFLLDKTDPKAVFYFTHSGTLLKVLSHISLYKDDFKLKHDTEPSLRETRSWKISQMNSFGNNLIFVLFRCHNEDKLLTLHQERQITLSGCPKDELCPLSIVRNIIPSSTEHHCDFSKICSI